MEQGMMDAERGRVIHRRKRTGTLAVVVAVQNVVVAACLIATLFLYLDFPKDTSTDTIVHIEFEPLTVPLGNMTLKFKEIASKYKMDVNTDKNKIDITCKGPYIWYMDVCYKSLTNGMVTTGILQLKMDDTVVSNVTLTVSDVLDVCRGHQSVVYLRANTKSSLDLNQIDGFKVLNVTVGLSYLLGKRCEF
ncbi:uncharacterized protein LOC143415173 [Maylandia zebra]|uniref:uncharacterized protein LOC143415173 n=1 Tax=Maylandia zebra TaxID=106582 RepID=UPI00403CBD7C